MLPPKIGLTEQIIDKIKTVRIAKRFPAATLSKAINRDDSYISSLELGRLRTISAFDLTAIFCTLYSIREEQAVAMIEQLLGEKPAFDGSSLVNEPRPDYEVTKPNYAEPRPNYAETSHDQAKPELIGDMLETMTELMIESYNDNPKEAVFALKCFIETMQSDSTFATEIMSMPFYTLKSPGIEEQKEILGEILEVIKKHAKNL